MLFLLTKEHQESYENAKTCCICKEKFENIYFQDKKYRKVRDIEVNINMEVKDRTIAYSICNLKYSVPKKIPLAFHSESN